MTQPPTPSRDEPATMTCPICQTYLTPEWLAMMADPLLAQSAVDRLTSTAHELVVEGESYRRRQHPGVTKPRRETTDGGA
jgi:IstB-like ATP binding protein